MVDLSRATHVEILQMVVSSISTYLWELIKREWTQDHVPVELI